jgi:predicted ATPase
MNHLSKISVSGFRSIKQAEIPLRPLNVFIGANGAGKSNLIAFIQMLNFALSRGLQTYVQKHGGATDLLHFGPKRTPVLHGQLTFRTDRGSNEYRFSMVNALGDTLIYTHEVAEFHAQDRVEPQTIPLGPGGHKESGLTEPWSEDNATARVIKSLLGKCRVYQFHDTSMESFIRGKATVADNLYLRANAGNLPAFLLRLKNEARSNFADIERTLQVVLPWFQDFVLEPQEEGDAAKVLLRWRMVGQPDYEFTSGHLSDGSLRIMALVTLLLQPEALRPQLIVLDEPELGLHPAAERVVAGLIKSAAQTSQVLVSTQSATFVDHFSPEDIVVVECEAGCSSFARQTPEKLNAWLERYTLGQIWQKDIIGGRP